MTTFQIANTADAIGGAGWTFDASNFLTAPAGTGINVGAPALPDQPNSVNVTSELAVNGTNADALFALLVSPTFTGTATFSTANVTTANVTTCQSAHYEFNGVDIKAGRALNVQTGLLPSGFRPAEEVYNQFAGLNQTITPAVSGMIYILISGDVHVPVGTSGGAVTVFYGTGTPPTAGTPINTFPNFVQLWATNVSDPFPVNNFIKNAPFTGTPFFLGNIGTTYWVDISVAPFQFSPSANATVSNVNLALVEV